MLRFISFSVLLVTFAQRSTGYDVEEPRSFPLVPGNEDTHFGPTSSAGVTTYSSTFGPCDVGPRSELCYQKQCRGEDPYCLLFHLGKAPRKLHAIHRKDYIDNPVEEILAEWQTARNLALVWFHAVDKGLTVAMSRAVFSVLDGLYSGLKLAIEECKHQMFWEPWNCPISTDAIVKGDIQRTGTRQAAYLEAISAAAVMHYVAKTCSHKENDLCKCGRLNSKQKRKEESKDLHFMWGGCNENVRFGERISEQFFGSEQHTEKASQLTVLSKRHNQRLGRMAVKDSVALKCRCHGPSVSCMMKTCWTALSKFRKVGDYLLKRYERIVRVKNVEDLHIAETKHADNGSNSDPLHTKLGVTKRDLVYFADSIDYCQVNYTVGNLGPIGRECFEEETSTNVSSKQNALRSSCEILCRRCGHEVEKVEYGEIYECECQELWCCTKRCKQCIRKRIRYFCK